MCVCVNKNILALVILVAYIVNIFNATLMNFHFKMVILWSKNKTLEYMHNSKKKYATITRTVHWDNDVEYIDDGILFNSEKK